MVGKKPCCINYFICTNKLTLGQPQNFFSFIQYMSYGTRATLYFSSSSKFLIDSSIFMCYFWIHISICIGLQAMFFLQVFQVVAALLFDDTKMYLGF